MAITWLIDDFPQGVLNGFELKPMPNTYESTPVQGVASTAPIFPDVPYTYRCQVPVNAEQKARFEEWHRVTLAHGSLPFEWKHPETDETRTMQFSRMVNKEHWTPEYKGGDKWFITLGLVIHP